VEYQAGTETERTKMTNTTLLTRAQILTVLEAIGKDLANYAEPSYWRHEDRSRASYYAPQLEAARKAYKAIKTGAEPLQAAQTLYTAIDGTQGNFVRLLIGAIQGEPRCRNHRAIVACLEAANTNRPA
jgi:hypothetical protein